MRKICLLMLVVIMLSALAACQPTPDKDIVVKKDAERMLEKATESAAPLVAPTHYAIEQSLTNPQGSLTITTDAKVIVPSDGGITSARVSKHKFSEEECAQYISALFNGQKTYSGEVLRTKSYYMAQISELKQQLASATDDEKVMLMETINKYEEAINNLPAGEGLVETAPKFLAQESGAEKIYLVSDGNDGLYRTIDVTNDKVYNRYILSYSVGTDDYSSFGTLWSMDSESDVRHGADEYGYPAALPNPHITTEEAITSANEMLQKLGIAEFSHRRTEMVFGNINGKVQKAYRLSYARMIGNSAFTLTDCYADGATDDGKGGYIESWEYERLTFIVTDTGIVNMEWVNPYDVGETITSNTNLLIFYDIADIYKKMIVVSNSYTGNDMTISIHIDRIELGLTRVIDTADRGSGLVIPVWDFFGSITYTFKNGDTSVSSDPLHSFLTINAITGSMIDRELGY